MEKSASPGTIEESRPFFRKKTGKNRKDNFFYRRFPVPDYVCSFTD